jgi:hypothetical protein
MHTMTNRKVKSGTIDVKALLAEDGEFLRALARAALQEVLEAEMTEALSAEKGERTAGRLGYRSGYYDRTLITRVGKLELRVPQDRAGAGSRPSCSSAISDRSGRWWQCFECRPPNDEEGWGKSLGYNAACRFCCEPTAAIVVNQALRGRGAPPRRQFAHRRFPLMISIR